MLSLSKLSLISNSSCHAVMANLLAGWHLFYLFISKGIVATSTVRSHRTVNSPLWSVWDMKEKPEGTCDVVKTTK